MGTGLEFVPHWKAYDGTTGQAGGEWDEIRRVDWLESQEVSDQTVLLAENGAFWGCLFVL